VKLRAEEVDKVTHQLVHLQTEKETYFLTEELGAHRLFMVLAVAALGLVVTVRLVETHNQVLRVGLVHQLLDLGLAVEAVAAAGLETTTVVLVELAALGFFTLFGLAAKVVLG
jgi:hypothetical protein